MGHYAGVELAMLCVCPSICLSCQYCAKMAKHRIMETTPQDRSSAGTL